MYTTIIQSNGSKWRGESPDPIETLLGRLADTEYILDPVFEKYGNFAENVEHEGKRGFVLFHGNFLTHSAVFSILSDDPAVCGKLFAALKAHKGSQRYRNARDPV